MNRAQWLQAGLVGLALIQPIGFLLDLPAVRGIGLATMASPLPIVFTQFRGVETYALRFDATVTSLAGETQTFEITPSVYSKLKGPYNLRNVYGAVISYGPGFQTEKELAIFDAVIHHGVCEGGALARDFPIVTPVKEFRVTMTSLRPDDGRSWTKVVECRT